MAVVVVVVVVVVVPQEPQLAEEHCKQGSFVNSGRPWRSRARARAEALRSFDSSIIKHSKQGQPRLQLQV